MAYDDPKSQKEVSSSGCNPEGYYKQRTLAWQEKDVFLSIEPDPVFIWRTLQVPFTNEGTPLNQLGSLMATSPYKSQGKPIVNVGNP